MEYKVGDKVIYYYDSVNHVIGVVTKADYHYIEINWNRVNKVTYHVDQINFVKVTPLMEALDGL